MWLDFKIFIWRMVAVVSAYLRITTTWSKIHRILFDRAAYNTVLPTFRNIEEIEPFVRGFVWRPDSWIDLGDAICSPEMVWYRWLNQIDHKVGDCDDFAVFTSNVIQKSIEENVWQSNIEDPDILSTYWYEPGRGWGGHAVCLIRMGSMYGYFDYDIPRWCGKKEDVAPAVRLRYAGKESVSLGWVVVSPKLKLREVHSK